MSEMTTKREVDRYVEEVLTKTPHNNEPRECCPLVMEVGPELAVAVPAELAVPAGSSTAVETSQLVHARRRREKNPQQWKRVQRKNRRVAGLEYVNTKGQLVRPKQMGPACGCRMQCYTRVDEDTRTAIFSGFYALQSYDEQNAYLFSLIRKKEIARSSSASERRTCNYQYFVRSKGREIQLCKLAFANIHAITFKKIRMLSQKLDQNVMFPRDRRGKHLNRPGKIPDHIKDQVRKHIQSILQSESLKSFLKEDRVLDTMDINISKMHQDYLKKFEPESFEDLGVSDKPREGHQRQVKIWLYSSIYHTEFRFANLNALRNAQQLDRKSDPDTPPAGAAPTRQTTATSRRNTSRQKARLRTQTPAAPGCAVGSTPAAAVVAAAPLQQQQPLLVQQLQLPPQVDQQTGPTDLMSLAVEQVDGFQQLVLQPAARGATEPLQLCLPITCLPQPLNLQAQPLNLHHTHTVFSVQPAQTAPPSVATQTQQQFTEPPPGVEVSAAAPVQMADYGGEVHLVTSAGAGLYDWQLAAE